MLALRALPENPAEEHLLSLAHGGEAGVCTCGGRVPLRVRLGLRSRTRPVFEGRWACSTRCLEREVAAAMRRETQRGPQHRQHRHRVPLGLVLLSTGAVTHQDLRHALAQQHRTGGRIGDALRRECGLSELQVAEALALQWGCGVETAAGGVERAMACVAPHALLDHAGMLPVRMGRDGRLHVAFAHSVDTQAVFALQRMHGLAVRVGMAPVHEWQQGHGHLARSTGVPLQEADCTDVLAMQGEVIRLIERVQPVESRWMRVHELYWLRLWLEPAALAGGPMQREDVLDVLYRIQPQRSHPLA